MGRYEEAKVLLIRAIASHEKKLGPNHPNTIDSKRGLEILRSIMGK
jgi:Tetratricopeptide repeat